MKFRRTYSRSTRDALDGTSPILPPTSFMERPTLDQFLLLSILWHVLAIVLLGDTSGVGAKWGNRLWGATSFSFNATLNADTTQLVSGLKLDKKIPTLGTTSRLNKGDVKKNVAPSRVETSPEAAPLQASAENTVPPTATPSEKNPMEAVAELPPVFAIPVTPAVPDPQTPTAAIPESLSSAPAQLMLPTQSVMPEALRFIAQDVVLPVTTFVVAQPALPPEPVASSTTTPVPPPVVRALSQSVTPVTATSPSVAAAALPITLTAVPTFNVAPPPSVPVPVLVPAPAPTPIPERILVAPKMPKLESAPVEVRVALPPTPTVTTLPPPPPSAPATVFVPVTTAVEQKVDIKIETKIEPKIEPKVAVKPPEVKPPDIKPVITTPTEIKLPDIKIPEVNVSPTLPTITNQPFVPALDAPKLASPPNPAVSPPVDSPISPATNPSVNPLARPAPSTATPPNAASGSQRAPDAKALADTKADLKSDGKLDAKAIAGIDPVGSSGALPSISNNATNVAPKLDLDALRNRARAITSEGSGPRTLLPFPVAPPVAVKKKVEEIFDKALKRPDCKDAYADLGLAAVVPLVRDAITEKGCKW